MCFIQVLSGVALLSFRASRIPKDKEHPYGHFWFVPTLFSFHLIIRLPMDMFAWLFCQQELIRNGVAPWHFFFLKLLNFRFCVIMFKTLNISYLLYVFKFLDQTNFLDSVFATWKTKFNCLNWCVSMACFIPIYVLISMLGVGFERNANICLT